MLEPRLDPDEIEYLKDFMSKKPAGTKLVEWGSGGSTAMFLPYFETGQFISIEHNEEWFSKVAEEISIGGFSPEPVYSPSAVANFTYVLARPKIDIRFYGYGVPHEENPCFAIDYIDPKVDGVNIWDADIYFVDGICRGPILSMIRHKRGMESCYDVLDARWIEKPPTIFIHDYFGPEQREPWYEWAARMYGSVEKVGSTLARIHW